MDGVRKRGRSRETIGTGRTGQARRLNNARAAVSVIRATLAALLARRFRVLQTRGRFSLTSWGEDTSERRGRSRNGSRLARRGRRRPRRRDEPAEGRGQAPVAEIEV